MNPERKQIYFHVGLGKVASTYLQNRFFPKLEGITYIPTGKYRKSKQLIPLIKDKRVLVSREFDRQLAEQVKWFTGTYPEAEVIILLRRQDSWIASQYRRYVKNGFQGEFKEFLDVENNTGHWDRRELQFYPKLEVIEACCQKKPLVLFYDDLQNDTWTFLEKISKFTGTTFRKEEVSLERVHTSYSENQLLVLRKFCRNFLTKAPTSYQNKILHWLLYRPWWAMFHILLYAAAIFPKSWIPKENLIDPNELEKVREFCEEDWNRVNEYARAQEVSLPA